MDAIANIRKRLGSLKARRHLRDSDVILASFPKSGNTWIRFIWANLISLTELEGRVVDFHVLNRELGSEYDSCTWGTVLPESIFRLVKTHRQYDPAAFSGRRTLYVWRHPCDVAVSYFLFLNARRDGPTLGTLSEFLRHDEWGIPAWCRHVSSWLPNADQVVRYEELRADAEGTVRKLLHQLGIHDIDDTILKEAILRSSFDRIRDLEVSRGRPSSAEFKNGYRFARSGTSGGWRETLSETDIEYLYQELESYGLAHSFREAYG